MEGHLLLFDLGSFKIERFREIDDSGGFFISRLKTNSNPLLLRNLREGPRNRIDLRHWRLREVEPYLRRQVLDAEGLFAPRNITDKKVREIEEGPVFRPLRFVGVKNEKTGEYHLHVTHLPADKVSPEEIADLYRARWAVEIFFKELKSPFGLSSIGSGKKHSRNRHLRGPDGHRLGPGAQGTGEGAAKRRQGDGTSPLRRALSPHTGLLQTVLYHEGFLFDPASLRIGAVRADPLPERYRRGRREDV
ncbi:transposase [Aminithiophilus ramosus]|uniref:Transposase n=2 Tax=Synergistales TaxID=649776 RepID=A0A9Q7EVI3_9BACT|nr:transposase [Aminithiophilus ramosus]QTX32483.1 transposase [Aminithiophilus ramosus]QVL36360.1 transposase [Synergistota bacterium]